MAQRITRENSGLDHKEWQLLKSLSAPAKIQDFLNTLSFDFSHGENMDRSVRGTLKLGKTDCAGGAILAAAALWINGEKPLLLDLVATKHDFDHVVALFKKKKLVGAISKTNHAVLRYREPLYRSVHELVMSYFHEYFLANGQKTLRKFSQPFDLSRYGTEWLTNGEVLHDIIHDLDRSTHEMIATPTQIRDFRKADGVEIAAGEIIEYKVK